MVIFLISFTIVIICDACKDTLAHHYSISIFSRFKNSWFWDANVSWMNKYEGRNPNNPEVRLFPKSKYKLIRMIKKPTVFTDGWHLFKGIEIFALILMALTYKGQVNILIYAVLGCYWNLLFNLMYNHILIKHD